MTNGDEGSAPMVIVLKYNADAIRQCSRKLVGEVRDVASFFYAYRVRPFATLSKAVYIY